MLFVFSLSIVLCSFLTITNGQIVGAGSCLNDLKLDKNGGCCALNTTCCTSGGCCCDQRCYDFNDCCLDVWLIDCPPTEDQTPIPPMLYNCAESYGSPDGCCTSNCRSTDQLCYCDQDCFHHGDCCFDISDVGCKCNFTCYEHYGNISGCCQDGNCDTTCCKCDQDCHIRGDCCMDILDWGCYPLPEPTTITPGYCLEDVTVHDNAGNYTMSWNVAPPGILSEQICDSPRNGTATRYCLENGTWGEPNIVYCRLTILEEITIELDNLNETAMTADEQVSAVSIFSLNLTEITAFPFTHIYLNDITSIFQILYDSIAILQNTIGMLEEPNPNLEMFFLDVFNNLLEERYNEAYRILGNSTGGSNDLISAYEQYANYASMFSVVYRDDDIVMEKDRLVFSVKVFNGSEEEKGDVRFPDNEELMQFNITEEAYPQIVFAGSDLDAFSAGGNKVAITNTLISDVADYLYNDFEGSNTEIASIILSSVLSSSTQSGSLPATLNFTTDEYLLKNVTNSRCAFWDSSANNGYGDWSTEGIDVVNNTITTNGNYTSSNVVCRINHLTPFVVLVDVHDIQYNPGEEYALEIVGLIGVSVSIVFLMLTIIFLMFLGKQLVLSTQYFVHFNLSIALLGGYITFLLFIDDRIIDVTNYKVGCAVVAGFLQFFFTAAFSWMMCEGIMLFLLLVIVFTSIGKRWYVFLIIGWGVPVIPVAISAGLIHDQYGSPGKHCWIDVNTSKTAIWAFVVPMFLILMVNMFFLIMSIRALILYHRRKQMELNKKVGYTVFKKSIIGTITLLPLMGITWLIGLLAVDENTTVFAWLFVVLNTLQGLFIFIFNIARNEKIQERIMTRCCPKRSKKKKSHAKRSDSFAANNKRSSQQFLMTAAPSTKETIMLSDEVIASETDDDLDDDPDIDDQEESEEESVEESEEEYYD